MRRRGRSGTSSSASSEPTCSTVLTVSGASAVSVTISSTWPPLLAVSDWASPLPANSELSAA